MKKIFFIMLLILLLGFFWYSRTLAQNQKGDVIGIRIVPNPDYLSPQDWYEENIKIKGAPSSLEVDGYEAVQDGRTVYVNAANLDEKSTPTKVYTNIYIISFSQSADRQTINIFNQILKNWTFNRQLNSATICQGTVNRCDKQSDCQPSSSCVIGRCFKANKNCLNDRDCPAGDYCNSLKARLTRDVRRLSRLRYLRSLLERYVDNNGYYPKLEAGTYLAGRTISTWPSWQETFGRALGENLPIDPLNFLGRCKSDDAENDLYNPLTCWNEKDKTFADPKPDNDILELPVGSSAFVYQANTENNGFRSYNLCAVMESGFITSLKDGACAQSAVSQRGNYTFNNPPDITINPSDSYDKKTNKITVMILPGNPVEIFVEASDPDGDNIANLSFWRLTNNNDNFFIDNTTVGNIKRIYTNGLMPRDAKFSFELTVVDRPDGDTNQKNTSKIYEIISK